MTDQRTPAWFAARLGKATASRISDIVAKTKTGYSTSRTNYAAQLVAERLTGVPQDSYCNPAMQWGIDTEGEARQAYCFHHDCDVAEVGFIDHPTIAMSGASPDGTIGERGLLELKCPQTATHIATLLGGSVPSKYYDQIQWQIACTERGWCDFVSYDPRLPEEMRLFVRRIERDAERIALLETEITSFLREVDETVLKLTEQYQREKVAA